MKVIVKSNPNTNTVIAPSANNAEYGVVRLEATAFEATNGMLNSRKRVAFLRAKIEDLESLNLKDNGIFPLQGKIIVKESLTPFYAGQDPKINPSTGEVMTKGNEPIYRITEFTTIMDASDSLILHDTTTVDALSSVASDSEVVK